MYSAYDGIIMTFLRQRAGKFSWVEKPGAILTRVGVPGAATDLSLKASFRCRFSYSVRTAPVYNHTHQYLCIPCTSQTLVATPLFRHTKILYTMVGMGNDALAQGMCVSKDPNVRVWQISGLCPPPPPPPPHRKPSPSPSAPPPSSCRLGCSSCYFHSQWTEQNFVPYTYSMH